MHFIEVCINSNSESAVYLPATIALWVCLGWEIFLIIFSATSEVFFFFLQEVQVEK